MIKRGRHVFKNHMTLEYKFTGIRIQDSSLTPVNWQLAINIVALEKKGQTKEEIEFNASLSFQKIYYWLETNLPDVVMVDVNSEDDLYLANLTANIMMYCPGNPGDDMIVKLLHSKISALAGDELIIGDIQLKGSDTSVQYTYDCPTGDYLLPITTKEYCTSAIARDEFPWWQRNDGFCFEFLRFEDVDKEISNEELFKDIVDPMNEFSRMVSEMSDTSINLIKEPARIVQIEKWKPKTI